MTETGRPAFAGILGFRRSRRNILGNQARLVFVEDGVLRVVANDGEEQERVALASAEVELRRGLVRVSGDQETFFLYGLGQLPRPARPLLARLPEGGADVLVGPADGVVLRSALDAAGTSRRTYEALVGLGARAAGGDRDR